jgi:hypothetical protein
MAQASWGKSEILYPKQENRAKKAEGIGQVVEYLPSKCKALSSNPIPLKMSKIKAYWDTVVPIHLLLLWLLLVQGCSLKQRPYGPKA